MGLTRIGEAKVDFDGHVVESATGRHAVEPKVIEVLRSLVDKAGEVVTRDELIEDVWDAKYGGDERLSRAISLLRRALGDDRGKHAHIETIPKQGYRLVARVERDASGTVEPQVGLPARSIAVLPFVDMSSGGNQQYLGDGIAEEIINALTKVTQLKVASRTSSFVFRGEDKDLREIGRSLNVAHVLEGSVRAQGDHIRITGQLIAADDGYHRWSETFKGSLADIFQLQDDIARSIVAELEILLELDGSAQLAERLTANREAYEYFLRGRSATYLQDGPETLPHAIDWLERAVAIDPEFAEACAFLSMAHFYTPEHRITPNWRDHHSAARRAAERAQRLAPDNPAVQVPRIYAAAVDRRIDRYIEVTQRCFDDSPRIPRAEYFHSVALAAIGLSEQSLRHLENAEREEPIAASGVTVIGHNHLALGDAKAAEAAYRRAFAMGYRPAAFQAAWAMMDDGRVEAARRYMRDHFDDFGEQVLRVLDFPFNRLLVERACIDKRRWAQILIAMVFRHRWMNSAAQSFSPLFGLCRYTGNPGLYLQLIRTKPIAYFAGTLTHIWEPGEESRRIRTHPDFPQLAEDIGLVRAWQVYGWPRQIQPKPGTDGSNLQFTCS
ncbi:MAG: hypothetical protein HKN78_05710 [Sphingomonadaceae bacterium]|nr:hypothetical protein [Sphingomonadaceae bacterium]